MLLFFSIRAYINFQSNGQEKLTIRNQHPKISMHINQLIEIETFFYGKFINLCNSKDISIHFDHNVFG